MGITEELIDELERRLSLTTKKRKIAFYIVSFLIIALSISILFSLWYVDSLNPLNLLREENNIYFVGAPQMVTLHNVSSNISLNSNVMNADSLDSVSPVSTNPIYINVTGRSVAELYSPESIVLMSRDGSNRTVQGPLTIKSSPDSAYNILIYGRNEEQSVVNNTHLSVENMTLPFLYMGNQYFIDINSTPGTNKSFDNIQKRSFSAGILYIFLHRLNLSGGTLFIEWPDGKDTFSGDIQFNGTLSLSTNDSLVFFAPVVGMGDIFTNEMTIAAANGDLAVGREKIVCGTSDSMWIISPKTSILFFLMNKEAKVGGTVKSLLLNKKEQVTKPIKKILNEKYFYMIIAVLGGLLVLFVRKIIAEYKIGK